MKFSGPLKSHEYSTKANPKRTLIVDSILLGLVVLSLILIHVAIIIHYGFHVLLILSWLLFGGAGGILISSIVSSAKALKEMKRKMQSSEDEETL